MFKTTKNSGLFLATVLLTGIFAIISLSFNDVEASGDKHKDNQYYKSKSVIVKEVICNQNNINVGGVSINLPAGDIVSTLAGAQAQDESNQELSANSMGNSERSQGERNPGYNKHDNNDIVFVCKNNNNGNVPTPTPTDNRVYVVWEDESNGGDTDIFFTVSNDNGQTFNPPTDLSNNTGNSFEPQMIVSGNNVYVVWIDESNGGDEDILFTASNDNGQTFINPPIDLSNNADFSQNQQMLVSGNNVYVVWRDESNGGDTDIFFTASHDNGQTFDLPAIDLSNNAAGSTNPQMIASGNNVYISWQDFSNVGNQDIFFTASDDNGQTFDLPATDLSNNAGDSFNQQMIASGSNVYVVWIDESNGGDEDIFFTVSDDNGQTFDLPATDLSNNAGDSFNQQMIASGSNVYVNWMDNSNGPDSDIFFTSSNDNGQTFDLPATDLSNNADVSFNQQMIASGSNVYVVWEDDSNGGDRDIFFTASNDNGQTFDLPATDLSNNAGFSETVQMIASGNNVYITWQDDSNGGDRDIFFTVSNDNGQTFDLPATDLSNNAGNGFGQQLIVLGNNVYVVWIDDSNGGDDDILFTASNDNGQTFFNPPIDLSNDADGSGRQQMIAFDNNVYVVWVNSGNNDDIFFTVSDDNGQTFDLPATNLSNNDGNSDREQMIVQ